jgi:hypothetical protein
MLAACMSKKRRAYLVLIIALAGCASKRDSLPVYRAGDEQMPEFLNGPASLLLTNVSGYSARLETDIVRPYGGGRPLAGAFLQRGGRIVFQADQAKTKKEQASGIIFIWDASLGRGWTVSEALQGYAPSTSSFLATNVQIDASTSVADIINNIPCHRVEARINRADGSVAAYRVWQADDMRRFPIRIQSDSGGKPMTLTFSDLRMDSPDASLFNPPDGFVKYENPVALMNELILRQTTVERRSQPTELNASVVPPRSASTMIPEPAH